VIDEDKKKADPAKLLGYKIKRKIRELEETLDRKPYNKKTLEVLKELLD